MPPLRPSPWGWHVCMSWKMKIKKSPKMDKIRLDVGKLHTVVHTWVNLMGHCTLYIGEPLWALEMTMVNLGDGMGVLDAVTLLLSWHVKRDGWWRIQTAVCTFLWWGGGRIGGYSESMSESESQVWLCAVSVKTLLLVKGRTTPTMSCRGADELVLVRGSCRLNGMAQSSLPITKSFQ